MTYQELLKQIGASGQTGQWSQWDLDTAKTNPAFGAGILSYKKDYAAALDEAGRKAANDGAEALRRQYGSYLGGSDGSRYYGLGGPAGYQRAEYQGSEAASDISETLGKMKDYGDFSYGPAPEYQNRYQRELDSLLGQVQGYGPFSWSKESDPSYSAYAKQYRREGDRATANAMAQAAAATGGQVSTAAMTAASQAGDYYAGKLADKIPELYENAYQRYLSDYSLLTDKLGQTRTAEQSEYAKYLDQLGQYNADRSQAYSEYLNGYDRLGDLLGAQQGQDDREYSRWQNREESSYAQYLDQINYNLQQDALAREKDQAQQNLYQQQVDAMLAAGARPSAELLGQSGYSGEYAQAMENYYKQQTAARAAQGGGKNATSKGNSADSEGGDMDYAGLFAAARASGNPQSFLSNNYKRFGFTSSSGLFSDYKNWLEGQEAAQSSQGSGGVDWRGIPLAYSPDNQSRQSSSGGGGVDMESIVKLGYGPLSAQGLDQLVQSGQVEEYMDGNTVRFRRTGAAAPTAGTVRAWGR